MTLEGSQILYNRVEQKMHGNAEKQRENNTAVLLTTVLEVDTGFFACSESDVGTCPK